MYGIKVQLEREHNIPLANTIPSGRLLPRKLSVGLAASMENATKQARLERSAAGLTL
jgi:hypothetical protein